MTEQEDGRPVATTDERGGERGVDHPREVSARGWWQILRRAWREAKVDNITLLSAGVAFYGFLALFPALIAAVLVYGLVANPDDVQHQVDSLANVLPTDAQSLVTRQMNAIVNTSSGTLTVGLVIALAGALWTVSGAVKGLITATNIAYDEEETRGFLKLRGLAMLMTAGSITFVLTAVFLVAILPGLAAGVGLGTQARVAMEIARWPLLIGAVMVALAVVYRIAPDREAPKLRWASIGAIVATIVWIAASVGFSLYVDNFSSYGNTYGSLAGVIVLLLWFYVSAYIVLLGAEINSEAERHE